KRERIDGVLQDEQVAILQVRTQPFSVHVKFVAPKPVAGKEASYVQGKHNGKMRAKAGGPLALVGYITMEPTAKRRIHGTHHAITEAAIGNLIDRVTQSLNRPVNGPQPVIAVGECTIARHSCVCFDITDPAADGIANQYRTLIYFDRETNLPTRYEAYD